MMIQAGTDNGTGLNYMIAVYDGDGGYAGGIVLNNNVLQLVDASDRRLKSGITDSKVDALNIINNLRVVDFSYTQAESTRHTGYIAQEVKEAYPAMAVYHEESDTWGVAKSQLIPVLNRAVQQQQNQIISLEQQISKQQKLIQLLIGRIENLEVVSKPVQSTEPEIR